MIRLVSFGFELHGSAAGRVHGIVEQPYACGLVFSLELGVVATSMTGSISLSVA